MVIERLCASSRSSLIGSRLAAAMSACPASKPAIPYPVALDSNSKAFDGWSFLNSAISRGPNSSPIAFEPLITVLLPPAEDSEGVDGDLELSEHLSTARARTMQTA